MRISTVREMQRAAPRESIDLYAIAGLWTRRVKLGHTFSPLERMGQFQCGSGEELIMIAVAPGLGRLEKDLHLAFDRHRLHGEWFAPVVTEAIVNAAPLTSDDRDERFARFVVDSVRSSRAARTGVPGCLL